LVEAETSPAGLRSFTRELLLAVAPAVAAGFGSTGPLRFKGGREAITDVDAQVEQELIARIRSRYGGHQISGEELGTHGGDEDWKWHIDPIDGTLNYSVGIPFFCSSVAVTHRGRVMAGGVMDPLRGELFTAGRGAGAFLGEEPLRVSQRRDLREAIVSTQSSRSGLFVRDMALLQRIVVEPMKNRRLGTIALELAYVAAGRFDLLLAAKKVPQNLYDVAAGLLLVEEAGGRVSDAQGHDFQEGSIELVASNGWIHDEVLRLIRPHLPEGGHDPRG